METIVSTDGRITFVNICKRLKIFVLCIDQLRLELNREDAYFREETSAQHGLVAAGGDHGAVVQTVRMVRVPLLLPGYWEKSEE